MSISNSYHSRSQAVRTRSPRQKSAACFLQAHEGAKQFFSSRRRIQLTRKKNTHL